MNQTISEIISTIAVVVLGELLYQSGKYIYKKYQIIERKLVLFIFFFLLFGLAFIVFGLIFMLIELQKGTLTVFLTLCTSTSIFIGVVLLIILALVIVRKDEYFPVDPGVENRIKPVSPSGIQKVPIVINRRRRGWILSMIGFLLTADCIFLFFRFGPLNEPFISAEHEANDMIINLICGSFTLIGIVLMMSGIRMINRVNRTPQ